MCILYWLLLIVFLLITYKLFMKKYKLKLSKIVSGKRKRKTMKEMSKEIYDYETNNESVKIGLYYI